MTADGVDVVCLNCGSSSVKGARFRVRPGTADGRDEERIAEATIEDLRAAGGGSSVRDAAQHVFRRLVEGHGDVDAVGHRLVHGGPRLREPVVIDDGVLDELRSAVAFAPLHLPAALGAIDGVRAAAPDVPQIACFDTAFHASLPEVEWRLPIPRDLADRGVRRYGFHGLSYEYVVSAVGAQELERAVVAHLGNGASLVAIDHGRSVATSMGLTPTGGIPMGTRSGDLDPGVLLHLLRERGDGADGLETLVDEQSGLLGLGGTSDMKELLARRDAGDDEAALAVDVFCTRVAMEVGAYVTVLGALDSLVFTAGIGERAAAIRRDVCSRLAPLGVELDDARNERHAPVISVPGSSTVVRVVPTDEDAMIARHTAALVG